jgi:hypothetical protein
MRAAYQNKEAAFNTALPTALLVLKWPVWKRSVETGREETLAISYPTALIDSLQFHSDLALLTREHKLEVRRDIWS